MPGRPSCKRVMQDGMSDGARRQSEAGDTPSCDDGHGSHQMLVLSHGNILRSAGSEHSAGGTPSARRTISVQAKPQSQLKDCEQTSTHEVQRCSSALLRPSECPGWCRHTPASHVAPAASLPPASLFWDRGVSWRSPRGRPTSRGRNRDSRPWLWPRRC